MLSTALLFSAAGALVGPGGFGIVTVSSDDEIVGLLADIALFAVLFTDGQRANLKALKANWKLSGRALGLAMPLTMVGIALPAHYLAGLPWSTAFLLGAILSRLIPFSHRRLLADPTSRRNSAGCSTWSPGSMMVSPFRLC